jgi:hypothetical protein
MDMRNDAPLRSLLPQYGVQVRRVAVEDPGVITDLEGSGE